jgi:hypothetical protein
MTEEMIKLRRLLDDSSIEWEDMSDKILQIDRTWAYHNGNFYSVINGRGTYGGVDPFTRHNKGLLELKSDAVNDGEPVGWLTAKQVFAAITGINEAYIE